MCIRDSGKAAEDASNLLDTALDLVVGAIELVADSINVLSNFIENIIPVSYTHLDVYKRQVCTAYGMPALTNDEKVVILKVKA